MTQIKLGLKNPRKHKKSSNCPFCPPSKKDKDWKTFSGIDNNSDKLRENMLDPKRNGCAQQKGARPKDGNDGRQIIDSIKDEPFFKCIVDGIELHYSFEAHHSISGKEIIMNEPIEKYYKKTGGTIKEDTGYTINNCANGIFLPSYPTNYPGRWGNIKDDGDKKKRTSYMVPAMKVYGQAHIGSHTGFNDERDPKITGDYVSVVRAALNDIRINLDKWSEKCGFCEDGNEEPTKPFPPPYGLNAILDQLSEKIAHHIGSTNAKKWKYFISSYALKYHQNFPRQRSSVPSRSR